MSMPSQYFNQTLSWRKHAGPNSDGEQTFAATIFIKGRLEAANRMVLTTQGQQVLSTATLYLEPDAQVSVGDSFLIDGQSFRVLALAKNYGLNYRSHLVAHLAG